MPIKPENRARYPHDWKAIRAEILQRAGNRCEKCKAKHMSMIARGGGDDAGTYMTDDALVFDDQNGEQLGQCRMSEYEVDRMVQVVLTIAHLDHTPENNARTNLRAWCQKCHLAYDAPHHAVTAAATRRARCPTPDMFDGEAKA